MKNIVWSALLSVVFLLLTGTVGAEVLSEKDKKLYEEIFSLQNDLKFWKADIKIKKLDNTVLLPYVYAERYLHPQYYSKAAELNDWLK